MSWFGFFKNGIPSLEPCMSRRLMSFIFSAVTCYHVFNCPLRSFNSQFDVWRNAISKVKSWKFLNSLMGFPFPPPQTNYNKWWVTCHGLRKGRPASTSRVVECCWLYVDFSADKITNEPEAWHTGPPHPPPPPPRIGNRWRTLWIVASYRFLRIPPSARRI